MALTRTNLTLRTSAMPCLGAGTNFAAWAVSRANLSKCGKCGGAMQLRAHDKRAAAYAPCRCSTPEYLVVPL